jgi:hypothetical protein
VHRRRAVKRAIIVLCVTAGTARGEPQPLPAPSEWPPAPRSDYHFEAAAHVGLASAAYDNGDYEVSGTGVGGDVEVGFRYQRMSLHVYADVMHATDTAQHVKEWLLGAGVRARANFHGAFLGLGLGLEYVRFTSPLYDDGEQIDPTGDLVPLLDIHAGYTLPIAVGRFRPQILGVIQLLPLSEGGFASARLGIGLAY